MSATSDKAIPQDAINLYNSLKLRNIGWMQMAEYAKNGMPPYSRLQTTQGRLAVAENLTILETLLADTPEKRDRTIEGLKKIVYHPPEQYLNLLTPPVDLEPDDCEIITGYTAEGIRRSLWSLRDTLLPIFETIRLITAARVEMLEKIIPLYDNKRLQAYYEEQASLLEIYSAASQGRHNSSSVPRAVLPILGYFIFDRDDTLIDQHNRLLNPDRMMPLLNTIGANPSTTWAIASAGAIELDDDPAFKAIQRGGYTVERPFYAKILRGNAVLLNRVIAMDISEVRRTGSQGLDAEVLQKSPFYLASALTTAPTEGIYLSVNPIQHTLGCDVIDQNGQKILTKTFEIPVHGELTEVRLPEFREQVLVELYKETIRSSLSGLLSAPQLNENTQTITATEGPLTCICPATGTVTFQYGNTLVVMSLSSLTNEDNMRLFQLGDFKLFFILSLLDQARLTLSLEECPELKSLGILDIQAPATYQTISPAQVFFTDDKEDCVTLANRAGFSGIVADTTAAMATRHSESAGRNAQSSSSSSSSTPEPISHNTYVASLYDAYERVNKIISFPLERYHIRQIKDSIHQHLLSLPESKKPAGKKICVFRDEHMNRHARKISAPLMNILRIIDQYDRDNDDKKAEEVLDKAKVILEKNIGKKTTFFQKQNPFYATLLEQITNAHEKLKQFAPEHRHPCSPGALSVLQH